MNNSNLRDIFESIDFDDLATSDSTKVNNNNSQNSLSCTNCNNSDNIIEDNSQGIIVCKNCGQVLDSIMDINPEWRNLYEGGDNTHHGVGVSKLLPQSSLGTTIGGGNFKSRIKTLHRWSAMPYRERSLQQVFKQFQERCAKIGILKCIEDDAKIMYKTISECKHIDGKNKGKFIIIRGKNRINLIAACIFFACKRKGVSRSPKEIADIFEINYTDITKGCKNFQKIIKKGNIDINTGFSKSEDFVERYCKELHIKEKYTNEAIKIAKNINNMNIATVHTPFSIATSSILLMAEINNITTINKKQIAKKFGVSEVTINKTYKKVKEYKDILNDQIKVDDYITNMLNENAKHITIPETLIHQFKRFNLPTDKSLLESFTYKYSEIFTENTNLDNNNNDIDKIKLKITKNKDKIKNDERMDKVKIKIKVKKIENNNNNTIINKKI